MGQGGGTSRARNFGHVANRGDGIMEDSTFRGANLLDFEFFGIVRENKGTLHEIIR